MLVNVVGPVPPVVDTRGVTVPFVTIIPSAISAWSVVSNASMSVRLALMTSSRH